MDGLAVLCEYEEGGGILREYVAGVGMKENGNTYYYITDRLENVRYVLNESGAVVQSYLYSPFGQIHSSSGSLSQPYQYVGGEGYYTEEDTGLKLLGQRWYDGGVGRFVSRDPIGEEGGLNLYAYVGNNPINWIDTNGGWRIDSNCGKYTFAINQALEYIQKYGVNCLRCDYPQIAERLANRLNSAEIKCGNRGIRCPNINLPWMKKPWGRCSYFNPLTSQITICINTAFKSEHCPSICEVVAHELLHTIYSYTTEPKQDMEKEACCLKK